ncbi:MAG TPA: hypothetical protein VHB25_04740 [Gemmatimonadaceae bacterium]|nr:hypothetical protein [Gemmatimonadaceae bacterium]
MRRLIIALLLGLAMGYNWGYDDGNNGKESVVARTLEKFGTTKIKEAQAAQDARVQEALKP